MYDDDVGCWMFVFVVTFWAVFLVIRIVLRLGFLALRYNAGTNPISSGRYEESEFVGGKG